MSATDRLTVRAYVGATPELQREIERRAPWVARFLASAPGAHTPRVAPSRRVWRGGAA